ncbi:Probable siderophore transport system permease protein yfhA [Rothia kristinae]|nr:Probable siderophore transport system permease protein yfhA [Rothia kristinae]
MSASRIPQTRTTQPRTAGSRETSTADAGTARADLGLRAVRLGPLSAVLRPRRIVVAVVLILVTVLVFAANLGRGDFPMSVPDVLRTLAGGGTRLEETIVFRWRLGRAVVGLAVGAALAFSGALTQSVARNPLASPDVLGITNGASVAAVFVITVSGTHGLFGDAAVFGRDVLGVPVVAIIGSVLTAALVWWVAGKDRGSMLRLVLIGVGASMFLNAISTWLMAGTTLDQAAEARLWLTGSLNGRGWDQAWAPLICSLAALALAGGWPSSWRGSPSARRSPTGWATASGSRRRASCWSPSCWPRWRSPRPGRSPSSPSWPRRSPSGSPGRPPRRCGARP